MMIPNIADWQTKLFKDRHQAGLELAKRLTRYAGDDPVVLALPRGGLSIGLEVAKALQSPLDVVIARKIGLPHNKEFGIGAISEGNIRILDERIINLIGINQNMLKDILEEEQAELQRRIEVYRNNKPLPDVRNKTVILVDDGLATGVTAKAAIEAIRKLHPKRIVFAAPICAYDTAQQLRSLVDDVVCLATPYDLMAIGYWYQNFEQVTDEEVLDLLKYAREHNKKKVIEGGNHTKQNGLSL